MRAMHSVGSLLIAAALALPAASPAETVEVLGRPADLHVPPLYDPNVPTPLIVSLHAYSIDAEAQEAALGLAPLADRYRFLYLTPNGTLDTGCIQIPPDPPGTPQEFWNATDACCDFCGAGVDDSAFLRALIDEVKSQYNVDHRRVFVLGQSNGGFMAYRMACDHADAVAAVASLSGATFLDPADCTPAVPLSVLQIHGTADSVVPYAGGPALHGVVPSAIGTVERWAENNDCSLVPDTSQPPLDLDADQIGPESTVTRYASDCLAGTTSELWTIPGATHGPVLPESFTRLVVEHLFAHAKPGVLACADGTDNDGDSMIDFPFDPDCTGPDDADESDPDSVVVYSHYGDADPATEGWTAAGFGSVTSGGVVNDEGAGIDAALVYDDSGAGGSTGRWIVTPPLDLIEQAEMLGWKLRLRVRVADPGSPPVAPNLSRQFEYGTPTVRYLMSIGVSASGDPEVALHGDAGTQSYVHLDAGPGYHVYELVGSPSSPGVDLWVDGVLAGTGYTGSTAALPQQRITWGSGCSLCTGRAHYSVVEWRVGLTPVPALPLDGMTLLAPLAAAGLLILCLRGASSRRPSGGR